MYIEVYEPEEVDDYTHQKSTSLQIKVGTMKRAYPVKFRKLNASPSKKSFAWAP